MGNLRGLLDMMMDSPKCMDKGVVQSDKRIDEGVLQWFNYVESMAKGRNARTVLIVAQWVGCGRDGLIL